MEIRLKLEKSKEYNLENFIDIVKHSSKFKKYYLVVVDADNKSNSSKKHNFLRLCTNIEEIADMIIKLYDNTKKDTNFKNEYDKEKKILCISASKQDYEEMINVNIYNIDSINTYQLVNILKGINEMAYLVDNLEQYI
jgi:hypothetical protein